MKKNILIIIIAAAVVAAGGAFYGGLKYGQRQGIRGPGGFADINFGNGQMRIIQGDAVGGGAQRTMRIGGGMTAGDIISKDDKSITLKLRDGGSKIIFLSDAVEISKSVSGSLADLEVGKTVTIDGTANQDGSITARTIQLRPAFVAPVAPAPNQPAK